MAGASPQMSVTPTATSTLAASTGRSTVIAFRRGTSPAAARTNRRMPTSASAIPSAEPAAAIRKLSAKAPRTSCQGLAPSDNRTARSRWRATPRLTRSVATFPQATSSTRIAAATRALRTGRTLPNRTSSSVFTCVVPLSVRVVTTSENARWASSRACSRLTPALPPHQPEAAGNSWPEARRSRANGAAGIQAATSSAGNPNSGGMSADT